MILSSCLLAIALSTQLTAPSPTCGEVAGKAPKDRQNALAFCKAAIPKDLQVVGVIAMDSLLWVKVGRTLANAMRADRLSAEQVVKNWMRAWKSLSGSRAVTIYVEWQDVEIARGETTILSGDRVTFR